MKRLILILSLLLGSSNVLAQACPAGIHYCTQPPGAAYGQPHHQGGNLACSPNCGNSSGTGNSGRLPDAICLDGVGCKQPATNTPGTLLGYWDAYQAFPGASEGYSGWTHDTTVIPDSSVHNNALLANATAGARNPTFHYTGGRTPNVPELTFASTTPYTSASTAQFIRFPSSQDTSVQQLCPYTVVAVIDSDTGAGYEWWTNGTLQFGYNSVGSGYAMSMRGSNSSTQLKSTTQPWVGTSSSTFTTTQVPNIVIWTCSGSNGTDNLYVDGVQVFTLSSIGANPSAVANDVMLGGSLCSATPCTGSGETGRFINNSVMMMAFYSGTPSSNEIWQITRALVTRYRSTMVPIPQADTNTVCGAVTSPDGGNTLDGCSTNLDQFLAWTGHVYSSLAFLDTVPSTPGSGAAIFANAIDATHISAQNLETGQVHFQGYQDRSSGTADNQGISAISCTTAACTFTVVSVSNMLVGDFEYPYTLASSCGTQTMLWGAGQGHSYRIASINSGANTFTVNALPNYPFTACTGSESTSTAKAISGFGGHTWWMAANQNAAGSWGTSTIQENSGIFWSDNHTTWTEILSGGFAQTGSSLNPILINRCSSATSATCYGLSSGFASVGTQDSDPDLVYNDPTFCDVTGTYCGDGRMYVFNDDNNLGGNGTSTFALEGFLGTSTIDGYNWLGQDGANPLSNNNGYFIAARTNHPNEVYPVNWFQGPSVTFDANRHMWVLFGVQLTTGNSTGPYGLLRFGISPQYFPGNALASVYPSGTGTTPAVPFNHPFQYEQNVRYPCFVTNTGLNLCYGTSGGNWHGKIRWSNGMYHGVFALKDATNIALGTSQNGDVFWMGRNRIAKSNVQCVQSGTGTTGSWASGGFYAPSLIYDSSNLYVFYGAQHHTTASTDATYATACNFQGITGTTDAFTAIGGGTGGYINQVGLLTIPWHAASGIAQEFNWIKY